ncbi:MAG: hypothetical protein U1F60_01240 [Planctomycetota bacterium]
MGTRERASQFRLDPGSIRLPVHDGDVLEFVHPEARRAVAHFSPSRRVLFVNGMATTPSGHAESALALSLVQMCPVLGVYNKTAGPVVDLVQCLGDKWQFDGPLSPSARTRATIGPLLPGNRDRESLVLGALQRNPAAVSLFRILRDPRRCPREIFAHSQGNLILSNALQALVALDGQRAIADLTVHTFGSPAANWPRGLRRREQAFTWDPVTWLAGLDASFSISKVGMPSDSLQPITHAFLEYMKTDPAFVVNRFRIGALGLTLRMDEEGLADCLLAMGTNLPRVRRVFEHLAKAHPSDVDDIAEQYVEGVQRAKDRVAIEAALRADAPLRAVLTKALATGWTGAGERQAITWLRSL